MFIGLVIVIYASDIEGIDFENEKCLASVELSEDEQIIKCIVNKNLNDVAIIIEEKKWGLISEVSTYFVYHNGNLSEAYDDVRWIEFSPDGKQLAYEAKIDDKWYVVCGKEKSEPYDDVSWITFSPDGKKLAYATIEGNECWKRIMKVE